MKDLKEIIEKMKSEKETIANYVVNKYLPDLEKIQQEQEEKSCENCENYRKICEGKIIFNLKDVDYKDSIKLKYCDKHTKGE